MDARLPEGAEPRGFSRPESGRESRPTRIARSLVELHDSKGGFHFTVICLSLLALTLGLFFDRWIHDSYAQRVVLSDILRESRQEGLARLDDVFLAVADGQHLKSSYDDVAFSARGVPARLRATVGEALEVLSATEGAEPLLASGNAALGQINSLERVIGESDALMASSTEIGLVRGELVDQLVATRKAYVAFLDQTSFAAEAMGREFQRRLAVLSWLFGALLAVGVVWGMAFLRLFREEALQRRARQKAEMRADFMAYFDPVTGLANWIELEDRLASWISSGKKPALALVDIDGFRRLNNRFGRVSGDVILKELAFRLKKRAEKLGGFAARSATGDFALAVPTNDMQSLTVLANDISLSCLAPISHAGRNLTVTTSIGIAAFSGDETTDRFGHKRLLMMAAFALDRAKKQGGSCVRIFDNDLGIGFRLRRAISERLPLALAQAELQLFLRPQLDLKGDCVIGFEALLRWEVSGAPVATDDLISVAQEEGLIGEVDKFLLGQAIQTIAGWNRSHHSDYSISVKISAIDSLDWQMVEFVEACLMNHGLPPSLLTIEVTESHVADHRTSAADSLEWLRSLGCKISIGDFGAGFSCLSHLRMVEIDEVKIDRSFLSDLETSATSREFLRAILQLPKCLGCSVVLQGIETSQQRSVLRAFGANRIQGHLVGEPRPALEWLAETTYSHLERTELALRQIENTA